MVLYILYSTVDDMRAGSARQGPAIPSATYLVQYSTEDTFEYECIFYLPPIESTIFAIG